MVTELNSTSEEEHPCEQKIDRQLCPGVGVARLFWPGNPPSWVCRKCKDKIKQVADKMGFDCYFDEYY